MEDEKVRRWFAEHIDQICPEEPISEEKKQELFNGSWPSPQKVENLGVFAKIKDASSFDNIVCDPKNWRLILEDTDLFENWILPHATLFFGRTWFNRVKNRNYISNGIPFPMFAEEDRYNVENTPVGQAKIAKIVEKIYSVLGTYLEGRWYDGNIKKPGGYIIGSLKNEFIREIGLDMGYKLKSVPACPYCLSLKLAVKTPLVAHPNKVYSCPRCESVSQNMELLLATKKDDKILESYRMRKEFRRFMGITCVCPSDDCPGSFVPLSCVDRKWFARNSCKKYLKNFTISKTTQKFYKPPDSILHFPLTCPYCGIKFTLDSALKLKSGFRNKSGFLTGLPFIKIWLKGEDAVLDTITSDNDTMKNKIVSSYNSTDQISIKQHLNILIGEIVIRMSNLNTDTLSGLITWYFLLSIIDWMMKYSIDANNYFFGCNIIERDMTKREMLKYPGKNKKIITRSIRGQKMAIHQAIFHKWMDLLENNINELNKRDKSVCSVGDLSWFGRSPKFSGGPNTSFYSVVDSRNRITNNTPIRDTRTGNIPRLARVYSIYKDGKDYIGDIDMNEWQSIRLKTNTTLKNGDAVLVTALIMSDHPTHAPIQRIIRLRSSLKGIISRVLLEEKLGQSDHVFWRYWKNRVESARKKTDIFASL